MLDRPTVHTIGLGNLAGLPRGGAAIVRGLAGHPELRCRLQEMGFTPGCVVRLVAKAAFGGPLAFQVRGSLVALRRSDAACVEV